MPTVWTPEALLDTRRTGKPLHGLDPALDLRGHAYAAVRLLNVWVQRNDGGRPVYTRTNHVRTLPKDVRRLARAYVEHVVIDAAFPSIEDLRFAKKSYRVALEIEIENVVCDLLLTLADSRKQVRLRSLDYLRALQQLGLAPRRFRP